MTIPLDPVTQLTLTLACEIQCSLLLTLPDVRAPAGGTRPHLAYVMPFLAEEHIDIPTTDLLSWMFDKQRYDADKPVKALSEFVIAVAD